jgi:inner membrane protein
MMALRRKSPKHEQQHEETAVMSSPIVHAAAGYAIYDTLRQSLPSDRVFGIPSRIAWLLAAIFFSLLPDLDAIAGWLFGSLERFHNNASHSIVACLLASLLLPIPLRWVAKSPWKVGFGFIVAGYLSHLLIDLVTHGRGLMLFWPFTTQRFSSHMTLFLGVPWSSKLTSPLYMEMLLQDACFAAAVILLATLFRRRSDRRDAAQR